MQAVGLDAPLFAASGEGAYLVDVEGRRYVDWVMSWGPLLFGHADTETLEAVTAAARRGRRRDHVLGEGARRLAPLERSELWHRALKAIPGGVNSPVRAMRSVGVDEPFFVAGGEGAYLETADGRRLLDWVQSWGPLVYGHADPETVEAVRAAALDGTSFGAPTEREVELAEEIADAVVSIESVRLVSSGTEAGMSAIRLARAATGRDRILKFAGCYHGHADALLAEAGSGLVTLGIPSTPGVPAAVTADTLVCPYNDLAAVEAVADSSLAAVLVEPVAGNMGVGPPEPGFLAGLRALCDRVGALLVFDEVITGFRIARGGAQERFGVSADLTILGKIVGGGLPVGAFGGRRDVMERLAPAGDVYQAGTLSGNPLATAAGLSVLRRLRDPAVYEELERRGARLEAGLREAGGCVQRVGAMLTCFQQAGPVRDLAEARASDTDRYAAVFRGLLERGVYIAPAQYEAMFVSLAHGDEEIDRTVDACAALGSASWARRSSTVSRRRITCASPSATSTAAGRGTALYVDAMASVYAPVAGTASRSPRRGSGSGTRSTSTSPDSQCLPHTVYAPAGSWPSRSASTAVSRAP